MAIKIKGDEVISNEENLTLHGTTHLLEGTLTIGDDLIVGDNLTLGTDDSSVHHIRGKVFIESDIDVTTDSTTGTLIIGDQNGHNIGIDGNQIQARNLYNNNENLVSPLYIQLEGGSTKIIHDVELGNNLTKPQVDVRGYLTVTLDAGANLEGEFRTYCPQLDSSLSISDSNGWYDAHGSSRPASPLDQYGAPDNEGWADRWGVVAGYISPFNLDDIPESYPKITVYRKYDIRCLCAGHLPASMHGLSDADPGGNGYVTSSSEDAGIHGHPGSSSSVAPYNGVLAGVCEAL